MIAVAYPNPKFRLKKLGEKQMIFDPIRKLWLVLTEEEWVRQNFVQYLIIVKLYPSTMIALEKEILLNQLRKRFDILVYDKNLQPWMLVECKASSISLSEQVLLQVLRYNMKIPVPYIVITNGKTTAGWKKEGESLTLINELPQWETDLNN